MSKRALILEGGALRTFFSMGVVDYFLESKLEFDYVLGVSAGSMVGLNYIAGQKKRAVHVDMHFLHDSRYMGWRHLVRQGEFFNLDFLFGDTINQVYPLDYQKVQQSETILQAGVTNCNTGKCEFLTEDGSDLDFPAIKASSSYPLASKIKWVHDQPYLDGSISDALPYQHAMDLGYDKVVVVSTRDETYQKEAPSAMAMRMMNRHYQKYPQFLATFEHHWQDYNQQFRALMNLKQEQQVYVFQPQLPLELSNTETDLQKLAEVYRLGWHTCKQNFTELQSFLA